MFSLSLIGCQLLRLFYWKILKFILLYLFLKQQKILGQEFFLHSISLDEESFSLFSNFVTFIQIVKLFFHLKPDLIHLITIKPILFDGIATRLLNIGGVVIAVSGLGYIFTAKYKGSFFLKKFIVSIYRVVFGHKNVKVIFQKF